MLTKDRSELLVNKSPLNVLDFSRALSVTFGLQFSIEVPQLGLEIALVWGGSAGVGSLRACQTGEKRHVASKNEAP